MDTLRGLVDLMDAALAAAPRFHAPALFLYGGKDELVPDHGHRGDLARRCRPGARARPSTRTATICCCATSAASDADRRRHRLDRATPDAPLPSGADRAAAAWLAQQE